MTEHLAQFTTVDYCVFGGVLISSAICGIYYGLIKKRPGPENTEEYLLGSRNLKTIPVAMSLVAG
jgi:Na+/proline symporter